GARQPSHCIGPRCSCYLTTATISLQWNMFRYRADPLQRPRHRHSESNGIFSHPLQWASDSGSGLTIV
ncbi:hypothetical protein HAX54_029138, partial [Datura stramonium]|nr:hypothetical protein [Datura stramonium]